MTENEGAARGQSEARRMLAAWDAGESVFTVEMGGLGPGYEQCIQILVMEIIRDNEPLPEKEYGDFGEAAVRRCDELVGGFSGAQVGAARGLAYRFMKFGVRATLDEVEQDRRIQVSRRFPQPPPLCPTEVPGRPPAPSTPEEK